MLVAQMAATFGEEQKHTSVIVSNRIKESNTYGGPHTTFATEKCYITGTNILSELGKNQHTDEISRTSRCRVFQKPPESLWDFLDFSSSSLNIGLHSDPRWPGLIGTYAALT